MIAGNSIEQLEQLMQEVYLPLVQRETQALSKRDAASGPVDVEAVEDSLEFVGNLQGPRRSWTTPSRWRSVLI